MVSKGFKVTQHLRAKSEHGHVDKLATVGDFEIGEIYVSNIGQGLVSAWKRHTLMTSNLKVVAGKVRFVFLEGSTFSEVVLSHGSTDVLRVEPGTWMGFQGLESQNSILNMASMTHNPDEIERAPIDRFDFRWDE